MRIAQIRPQYFRAFGDCPPIVFNSSLTILYGGNGTGKSSLSEAIEWLLYGYTKRRRKGDDYSKTEYKGSYVNSNCPQGSAPFVEADLLFGDGSFHTLRREIALAKSGIPQDSESLLSLDGASVADLPSAGITLTEAHCPVIVQHGIQDFIHTRPIDRYRVISEALGLNDLVVFKDVIDKTKNLLRNNPIPPLGQARTMVPGLVGQLRIAKLDDIATRWTSADFRLTEDCSAIAARARELSGSEASDLTSLLSALRVRQAEEIAKLFDVSPFRASQEAESLLANALEALQRGVEPNERVNSSASAILANGPHPSEASRLAFWKQGLLFVDPERPDLCPFCEASTLTPQRYTVLQLRLKDDSDAAITRASFEASCGDLLKCLRAAQAAIEGIRVASLQGDQVQRLRELAPASEPQLLAFAHDNEVVTRAIGSMVSQLRSHAVALANLPALLDDPKAFAAQLGGVPATPQALLSQLASVREALAAYSATTAAFQAVLTANLSNQETVASFAALVSLIQAVRPLSLLAAAADLEREMLDTQRAMDQYILRRQNEAVAAREADILAWYSRLSPNPDVRFSGLQPGHNEIALKAEAFGRELNAAASLSQSQLNCLGLSIYIPCVTAPGSPFHFIVFDDPVQAMDDDHHESFLVNVIPQLLDVAKSQVIVLTHVRETADRLRDLYYTRDYIYYNFDKLHVTGPVISENIVLSDDMKKVRLMAEGNDALREVAVDRIRVVCERIMREAFFLATGSRMPVPQGTARAMLPFFGQVPGVTPQMVTDIHDTITWSNPAHHTQPGYSPPTSTNIRPHIERLHRMIKDLGLKA